MKPKKVSENALVLIFNGIFLFVQCVVRMEKIDILRHFLLIYIPVLTVCFAIILIIYHMNDQYNQLVNSGTIIKANINHELTKTIFVVKGLFIIKISCCYNDDRCTYIFEEQYSCDMYSYRKIKRIIEENNTIDVLVSEDFHNYHIVMSSLEGNTYRNDYFFVPAQFNYIVSVINIILLFVNVLNLLQISV